jgi:hypothetical protein
VSLCKTFRFSRAFPPNFKVIFPDCGCFPQLVENGVEKIEFYTYCFASFCVYFQISLCIKKKRQIFKGKSLQNLWITRLQGRGNGENADKVHTPLWISVDGQGKFSTEKRQKFFHSDIFCGSK